MSLIKTFESLEIEQRGKAFDLKTGDELEAFLKENKIDVTDDIKRQAISYIETGKVELTDDELEMVSGGCKSAPVIEKCRGKGCNGSILCVIDWASGNCIPKCDTCGCNQW